MLPTLLSSLVARRYLCSPLFAVAVVTVAALRRRRCRCSPLSLPLSLLVATAFVAH
ncbi:hypothetical protein BHE74_00050214, partial [Ensete ventricosum]